MANNQVRYLKPASARALEQWYAEEYDTMTPLMRDALATDVAEIMVEEELLPSQFGTGGAEVAVMILDLRIWPAPLYAYASTLL